MNLGAVILGVSALWIISEVILAMTRHSGPGGSHVDRYSLRLLWITIIAAVGAGYWLAVRRYGMISMGSRSLAMTGLGLIIAGLIIRWIAILTLRKYFTVDISIREDQRLVTGGLYRFIRHPAYTGSLLSFLGLGMVFANWLSFLVIFFPILFAFLYRIRAEERALADRFGAKYYRYSAGTKKLLPNIY